ncbi:alpha-amylase family protein [Flavobacteriaceae bacterium M23B6Z8]
MNQARHHYHLHKFQEKYKKKIALPADDISKAFEMRLAANFSLISELFFTLYPDKTHENVFEQLLLSLYDSFKKRPEVLKALDMNRVEDTQWYQSEKLVGMQLYADLFNRNIKGVQDKLPYLEELGVNFLHIMPLMERPKGENDGGYAVTHYTKVDKKFGSTKDLLSLTNTMRSKSMVLMLDFVVNHTADNHRWAQKAKQGEKKYQNYYYCYPDRSVPDRFDASMQEVFPQTAPGNFTYVNEMEQWIMTTFNTYQWDLNYTNPEVFVEMLGNLIAMGNLGVDIIRFDALAFLWKKEGTVSQNLPEAHMVTQLFRLCTQVIAPGIVYLAEAIVAPKQIIKYFGEGAMKGNECEIAYNATLMALLWESVATGETRLLYKSLQNVPDKPDSCTWVNYVRCHDDIGLGFEDEHIAEVGWDPYLHRQYILDYYCRDLYNSPAKGMLFMFNPETGDGRITGSLASLAGLEKAQEEEDHYKIRLAINKINLLHAIVLSYGGIPMIYSGDEIGTLNDYSFLDNANKKEDSRWLNRPSMNWEVVAEIEKSEDPAAQIFNHLKELIRIRKTLPVFADANNCTLEATPNGHIFAYMRWSMQHGNILVLCNFNHTLELVDAWWLHKVSFNISDGVTNLITGNKVGLKGAYLVLEPYECMWLKNGID